MNPMGYSMTQTPGARDTGPGRGGSPQMFQPRPPMASPQNTSMANMPRPTVNGMPVNNPRAMNHLPQGMPVQPQPQQQMMKPAVGYTNINPQVPTQSPQAAPQQFQPNTMPSGQPQIDAGPVFSQEQQSQLINQAVGQNAMQQGSANQQVMNHLNSAGFAGSGSPKGMAMQNQNAAARMMADTQARTSIPLQLADKNAQHLLAAQQAQEQQYGNRQNERLTGQGQQLGFMGNLFNSLLV